MTWTLPIALIARRFAVDAAACVRGRDYACLCIP
jgi:hypothetical protein